MKFHDNLEDAFEPLERLVSREVDSYTGFEKTLQQYMYMCHDENDIYYYKHSYDRSYLKLSNTGELVEGTLKRRRG